MGIGEVRGAGMLHGAGTKKIPTCNLEHVTRGGEEEDTTRHQEHIEVDPNRILALLVPSTGATQ